MKPQTKSFQSFQYSFTSLFFLVCCFIVLFSSGCTKEGPAGPPGDDNLSNPAVKPTVIFTLPGNGGTGPFNNLYNGNTYPRLPHFVVRFNKLMNKLLLQNTLITVQGSDRPVYVYFFSDYYYKDGVRKTSSNYDDILAFSIRDSVNFFREVYQIGKSYTVTLHPGLEDINGNLTESSYQFSYTPEPYFRVRSINPRNGTSNVSPGQLVYVNFNSIIDATIFPYLHLTPAVEGRWTIDSYDSTYVTFRPANGKLAFNQNYTVTVDPTAKDRDGNLINAAFSSSFHVQPFRISSTSPSDGTTNVYPRTTEISIYLNGPLDTSTVRSAFSISPSPGGSLGINSYGNISYYCPNGLNPQTTYIVSLSAAIKSTDGTPLQSPYQFSFTTQPFRVIYTYPDNGQTLVPVQTSIGMNFNAGLDTGSVRGAFSISPPVSGMFTFYYYGSDSFNYYPNSLSANTTYTVTVSTALKTRGGSYLPEPYTFSFKTAP